jgi:3-carboxy-cis,cis-muconate cycloisomerase
MTVIEPLYSTPEMTAIFAPEEHVRQMLAFEAALARAEAQAGVIPPEAADEIAAVCQVELFDIPALYREAALAGTLAIPLVKHLTALVSGDARNWVHYGATSQDAIDTAMILQVRDALQLLLRQLGHIAAECARLARDHRHTLAPARTLLQHALPITFGLKAARWLAMLTRQMESLHALQRRALHVQLGGAAGTMASLGGRGQAVTMQLAAELGLDPASLPWHTERDRIGDIAATVGVVVGALGKIANDLILMLQTDVGEVSEAVVAGKGGSSAMPHKRNPVDTMMALASARLALGQVPVLLQTMIQEHERAIGGWQAEWEALPALFRYTSSAAARLHSAISGLTVDAERMRTNLDRTSGLLMAESLMTALAERIGRPQAFRLVQRASEQVLDAGESLRDAARADADIRAALSEAEIDQALDPLNYLGSTNHFIDAALAEYQALAAESSERSG